MRRKIPLILICLVHVPAVAKVVITDRQWEGNTVVTVYQDGTKSTMTTQELERKEAAENMKFETFVVSPNTGSMALLSSRHIDSLFEEALFIKLYEKRNFRPDEAHLEFIYGLFIQMSPIQKVEHYSSLLMAIDSRSNPNSKIDLLAPTEKIFEEMIQLNASGARESLCTLADLRRVGWQDAQKYLDTIDGSTVEKYLQKPLNRVSKLADLYSTQTGEGKIRCKSILEEDKELYFDVKEMIQGQNQAIANDQVRRKSETAKKLNPKMTSPPASLPQIINFGKCEARQITSRFDPIIQSFKKIKKDFRHFVVIQDGQCRIEGEVNRLSGERLVFIPKGYLNPNIGTQIEFEKSEDLLIHFPIEAPKPKQIPKNPSPTTSGEATQ